ncbi:MAG: hypothetical protein AB7P20_11480 [Rhizobiaceae bacterium]
MEPENCDHAEYIIAMLAELRKLAEAGKLMDVAYLISVAESETRAVKRRNARSNAA